MQEITILSEQSHQSGQKHRSSNNFSTQDFPEKRKLTFLAYYRYGHSDQEEATEITFDIWVDKTGKDPVYHNGVKSGDSYENIHHRNLYIANPSGAKEQFTVVVR